MRVTYLGHAGLGIDVVDQRILIDPWFAPSGAYLASWFPYPDNEHVYSSELQRPAAVLLSHEHLDHLDPWFLARLEPSVPVFAPRYAGDAIRRKLRACTGSLVEVAQGSWFEPAVGVRAQFVTEISPMNHDAAVVIEAGGQTIVDMNDSRMSPVQLRAIRGATPRGIDVLALQGSGASWHPMCYEYPEEQERDLSQKKRGAKLRFAERAVRAAEPRFVIPFAGPPCFLDDSLRQFNTEMDGGVFPDQFQVAAWLRERGHQNVEVLLPGDALDVATGLKDPDPWWSDFSTEDRDDYIESYGARRSDEIAAVYRDHPAPESSLWCRFADYFGRLSTISPYFNERIDMRVGFDVVGPGGGQWAVDLTPRAPGPVETLEGCSYRYRVESRWIAPILRGELAWEDFLLSLRFSAWREPDLFNEHLLGLLKFADLEPLAAVEQYETRDAQVDRVVVEADGARYSVQRFCPHAGGDLLDTSEVLPGRVLRCLNHYYEFDLESGRCRNGICKPLQSERLSEE